jgi:hypothetical protein
MKVQQTKPTELAWLLDVTDGLSKANRRQIARRAALAG